MKSLMIIAAAVSLGGAAAAFAAPAPATAKPMCSRTVTHDCVKPKHHARKKAMHTAQAQTQTPTKTASTAPKTPK